MSTYTELEILSSIDNIDTCIQEASIDVLDATIREYDKFSQYAEFTIFEEAYFMEGKILDEATGKNTFDGFFKKALLFIPRLIMGIIKSIASVFTNKYDEDISTNAPKATENLNNANEPEQLDNASTNVETLSEGALQLDKKKRFILGDKVRHVRNYLRILTGLGPILKKLKATAKGGIDVTYLSLLKEIRSVIKGETSLDEARVLTAGALFELSKDANRISRAFAGIMDETKMKFESDMRKLAEAGDKDAMAKKAEAKEMIDTLSKIANMCNTVTFFGRVSGKIAKYMADGGPFFMRKIISKIRDKAAYDEEDTDIMKEQQKAKELKAKIKGTKQQSARIDRDTKRIAKKQEKLSALREKNAKLEQQLDDAHRDRDIEKEIKQDQSDSFWGRDNSTDEEVEESAVIETNDTDEVEEGFMDKLDALATRDPLATPEGPSDFRRKFNRSILARPVFNKDATEYWENHKDDPDYDALNSYNDYKNNKDLEGKDVADVMFQ